MKRGVWFIILTISSAVCERTDSICGGNAGAGPSWVCAFARIGKGVSDPGAADERLDGCGCGGGEAFNSSKSSGSSAIRDIVL